MSKAFLVSCYSGREQKSKEFKERKNLKKIGAKFKTQLKDRMIDDANDK